MTRWLLSVAGCITRFVVHRLWLMFTQYRPSRLSFLSSRVYDAFPFPPELPQSLLRMSAGAVPAVVALEASSLQDKLRGIVQRYRHMRARSAADTAADARESAILAARLHPIAAGGDGPTPPSTSAAVPASGGPLSSMPLASNGSQLWFSSNASTASVSTAGPHSSTRQPLRHGRGVSSHGSVRFALAPHTPHRSAAAQVVSTASVIATINRFSRGSVSGPGHAHMPSSESISGVSVARTPRTDRGVGGTGDGGRDEVMSPTSPLYTPGLRRIMRSGRELRGRVRTAIAAQSPRPPSPISVSTGSVAIGTAAAESDAAASVTMRPSLALTASRPRSKRFISSRSRTARVIHSSQRGDDSGDTGGYKLRHRSTRRASDLGRGSSDNASPLTTASGQKRVGRAAFAEGASSASTMAAATASSSGAGGGGDAGAAQRSGEALGDATGSDVFITAVDLAGSSGASSTMPPRARRNSGIVLKDVQVTQLEAGLPSCTWRPLSADVTAARLFACMSLIQCLSRTRRQLDRAFVVLQLHLSVAIILLCVRVNAFAAWVWNATSFHPGLHNSSANVPSLDLAAVTMRTNAEFALQEFPVVRQDCRSRSAFARPLDRSCPSCVHDPAVCLPVYMCVSAYLCLPVSTCVYLCLPVSTCVYFCVCRVFRSRVVCRSRRSCRVTSTSGWQRCPSQLESDSVPVHSCPRQDQRPTRRRCVSTRML